MPDRVPKAGGFVMDQRTSLLVHGQRAHISSHPLAGRAPGPQDRARSLYIHVPFCSHKCHYCDFYSIVDTQERQRAFLDRLLLELRALAPWAAGGPLATVFVGGGTPSMLEVGLWRRLLAELGELFDLSEIRAGQGEFTVECNPETVTDELLGTLQMGGVDRLSMGVQSLRGEHLRTLERRHNPQSVPRAIELARRAGFERLSVDLIYAIPGQSLAQWEEDLVGALSLGTEHISCYNLTYEPGTAMTARLTRGEFTPAEEDLEVEMLAGTLAILRQAGFERYEVSNYAKAGARCRHNMAYWRQEPWLAAGPSASGHVAGHRWKNVPHLDQYLTANDRGLPSVVDHEPPDARRALAELIMTGLRLSEGLDAALILERARFLGPHIPASFERLAGRLVERGQLTTAGGRWILTDAGMLLADGIASEFMRLLSPAR